MELISENIYRNTKCDQAKLSSMEYTCNRCIQRMFL